MTATLTVVPSPATPSAALTVTGAGFSAKRRYDVKLETVTRRVRASARGTLSCSFTASSTPKTQTITATDSVTHALLATTTVVVATAVPPPSNDHWSGIAFGSRTASGAIEMWSGTDVEISGKTFSGRMNPNTPWAAIRLIGCKNVWIHDCDFEDLEWDAIDLIGCSGTLLVEWCRVNPFVRSPYHGNPGVRFGADFVQLAESSVMYGHIRNNKIKAGIECEDLVSTVNNSGGVSATQLLEIDHNAFQGSDGTGYASTSGSGTMCADNDDGAHGHIWVHHNTYLNPGQVGVGISMGVDVHVTDNVIYGAQQANANVGAYTPYVSGVPNPGGHELARNRIWYKNAAGALNALFNGGASGTVSGLSPQTNTLDDATIVPADLAVVL